MLSRDIDTSKVGAGINAYALAEQMVRSQQTAINRFVAVQRQQIELGDKDVHTARLPLDGVDVYYTHVQDLERLHYHVQPEAQPPLEALEELKVPIPPAVPEAEIPALPEEEKKKPEPGQPDFLTLDIPMGLAVEFFDGAS
jgi:hypothetical protein